jgi:Na+-driven multidrug efflux pump
MSAKYDAGAEVKDIFKLAFAMFFTRVAWTAMKVTDTALIGHSKIGYP